MLVELDLMKAIKDKCLDCQLQDEDRIVACQESQCALWPHRTGEKPNEEAIWVYYSDKGPNRRINLGMLAESDGCYSKILLFSDKAAMKAKLLELAPMRKNPSIEVIIPKDIHDFRR